LRCLRSGSARLHYHGRESGGNGAEHPGGNWRRPPDPDGVRGTGSRTDQSGQGNRDYARCI